ncbi:hypothetical protein IU431_07970 [Nocardia otitidiscaviarum]|uniref:hypothetical protein n=1 Tax=Nocardia otitidiscaviarum TaxID=1823 RepID=UPI0011DC9FA6|nr:hypothetical protein [Nocardia otitidiscaviarum]MBF6484087.1 hypothetical protein [Nocardia otitidiscaviarum]
MKRILISTFAASALALGLVGGASNAAAEPGLPLRPTPDTPLEAGPIDNAGTGSAAGLAKLLASPSGCTAPLLC